MIIMHGNTEKNVDGDFMASAKCLLSCNLDDFVMVWDMGPDPSSFFPPHSKNLMDG
jgi:hypothetical protein